MPSGLPICALRASGRSISGKGSTGWRSPQTTEPGVTIERLQTADGQPWTPGQRAYDKQTGRVAQVGLTHEAQASGWPTPDTGMGPHGQRGVSTHGNHQSANDLLATARASGPPSSGSPAATVRRGQLNPALPRWLMGFPRTWCIAAISAHRKLKASKRAKRA